MCKLPGEDGKIKYVFSSLHNSNCQCASVPLDSLVVLKVIYFWEFKSKYWQTVFSSSNSHRHIHLKLNGQASLQLIHLEESTFLWKLHFFLFFFFKLQIMNIWILNELGKLGFYCVSLFCFSSCSSWLADLLAPFAWTFGYKIETL